MRLHTFIEYIYVCGKEGAWCGIPLFPQSTYAKMYNRRHTGENCLLKPLGRIFTSITFTGEQT